MLETIIKIDQKSRRLRNLLKCEQLVEKSQYKGTFNDFFNEFQDYNKFRFVSLKTDKQMTSLNNRGKIILEHLNRNGYTDKYKFNISKYESKQKNKIYAEFVQDITNGCNELVREYITVIGTK